MYVISFLLTFLGSCPVLLRAAMAAKIHGCGSADAVGCCGTAGVGAVAVLVWMNGGGG